MAKYDSFVALADQMIRQYGAEAVLTRTTPGSFDPVTQTETTTSAQHSFRAVGLPPGRSAEFRVGTLVGRNLLQFYLAAKGQSVTPSPGDVVRWAGRDWTLIWSTTYDPAADGAIFTEAYAEG